MKNQILTMLAQVHTNIRGNMAYYFCINVYAYNLKVKVSKVVTVLLYIQCHEDYKHAMKTYAFLTSELEVSGQLHAPGEEAWIPTE
jgi:hypothetical protein